MPDVWLILLPALSPQLRSSPRCLLHSSIICLFVLASHASFHRLSSSHLVLLTFSCLPSSTCSIMCAQCVSARFRATRFMSEVVVPTVRDTLTWWGDDGWAWIGWLLHRVSLLPPCLVRVSQPPHKGYTDITQVVFRAWCLDISLARWL